MQTTHFASMKAINIHSGNAVKVIVWSTGMSATALYMGGPESKGGRGNLLEKIQAEMHKTGKSYMEVAKEVCIVLLCV